MNSRNFAFCSGVSFRHGRTDCHGIGLEDVSRLIVSRPPPRTESRLPGPPPRGSFCSMTSPLPENTFAYVASMSKASISTIAAVSVGFTHESSLQLEANVARPKNTKLASNMLMKFFFISNLKNCIHYMTRNYAENSAHTPQKSYKEC